MRKTLMGTLSPDNPIPMEGVVNLSFTYRGTKEKYEVQFSIGAQTFTLRTYAETLKEVKWWHKQLKYALANLILSKYIKVNEKTRRRSYSSRAEKSNKSGKDYKTFSKTR